MDNASPTYYSGRVTKGTIVVLSSSYSNIWKTSANGEDQYPLLVNGFSMGVLADNNIDESSFQFSYSIQIYENLGIGVSITAILMSFIYLAKQRFPKK